MRFLLISCLLFVSACASLDELKRVEPKGSAFSIAVSRLYKDFSESEAEQYDWIDSQYFAEKGLKAAYGHVLEPENVDQWNIPENLVATFNDARAQLMLALHEGNVEGKPEVSARALVMYDCWIEQQEENWQLDHIAACRDGFYDALNDLTQKKEAPKADTMQFKPAASPSEVVETSYVIFFALNSTAMTKEGKETVDDVYNELSDDADYVIRLEGHADRSGKEPYNKELSRRRAVAVKTALEKKGLDKGRFTILAHGEEMPLIQTKDGVKEKANRRVEIFINE